MLSSYLSSCVIALLVLCCDVASALSSSSISNSRLQIFFGESQHLERYKKGQFSILEQSDSLCNTGNQERQWTGTVDVTDNKRLFYCWIPLAIVTAHTESDKY